MSHCVQCRSAAVIEPLERRLFLSSASNSGQFNFGDFSSTEGMVLTGNAASAGSALRLTPAAYVQAGSAWYGAKENVAASFATTFQFQITGAGGIGDFYGGGPGGDGFAFVIQNNAPTALGNSGEDIGFGGIPNSLAVEFDTFGNPSDDELNGNHISVLTRGTQPNSPNEAYSLGFAVATPILKDGSVHTAKIVYQPGSLDVFLDDLATPVVIAHVDLSDTLRLDAGTAWIGFTAATYSSYENHDILDWSFSGYGPPTISSSTTNVVSGWATPQAFRIFGSGFEYDSTATFTNLDTGHVSTDVPIANDASHLTVLQTFGIKPHHWSVQVNTPGESPTAPYLFSVIGPGILAANTILGAFNDVIAYSNKSHNRQSATHGNPSGHNSDAGTDTGLEWQCVEYVQRYYWSVYHIDLRRLALQHNLIKATSGGLSASTFFNKAGSLGLVQQTNGNATAPPEPGDIICFGGGSDHNGHVAIVREVTAGEVIAIQQNVAQTYRDANFLYTLTLANGQYTVDVTSPGHLKHPSQLGTSYWCQGWLRPAAEG